MTDTKMRDGSTVSDIRLGRLPSFDDKSRDYGVAQRLLRRAVKVPTSGRTWSMPRPFLDQNGWPECVAFSTGNRLLSSPVRFPRAKVTTKLCHQLYREAQDRDEWAGSDYDGTSALGMAKALTDRGFIDSYYWCFSVEEILVALKHAGPVLVGWPLYESMWETDRHGHWHVDPDSGLAGYHEIMLRGFSVISKTCRGVNQWGNRWGKDGEFYVSWDDMRDHLLPNQGDALVLHEVAPSR